MKKFKFKSLFSFWRDNLFWTALGVFIAGWVAYSQLKESNREAKKQSKIAAETFLHNLKTDFFNKETRDLIFLIDIGALHFEAIKQDCGKETRELPSFSTRIPLKFQSHCDPNLIKKNFTSDEIDFELLDHFEDLGILYKKGLVDSLDIHEYFSYYISLCHEDSAIRAYIKWARLDPKDVDVYDNFDTIYSLGRPHSIEK